MAADGGRVMSNEWDAFISYSRQATRAEAESLQARLQTFAKPWNRLRSARVFRDDASMSANAGLWPTIERALVEARYFILILSPAAAASQWVDNEVRWWLHYKGAGSILLVHAAGTVGWDRQSGRFSAATDCVPPALSATLTEEPRWVDLTWFAQPGSTGAADPRFQEIVADLAAPIRGVERDELVGEHVAQLRRTRRLSRIAIAALSVLLVLALVLAGVAYAQMRVAQEQTRLATLRLLTSESQRLSTSNVGLSRLLAVQANTMRDDVESRRALFGSLTAGPHLVAELLADSPQTLTVNPTGTVVAFAEPSGAVVRWDVASGNVERLEPGCPGYVRRMGMSDDGTIIVGDCVGDSGVFAYLGNRPIDLREGGAVAVSPSGRTVAQVVGDAVYLTAISGTDASTRAAGVVRWPANTTSNRPIVTIGLPDDETLVTIDELGAIGALTYLPTMRGVYDLTFDPSAIIYKRRLSRSGGAYWDSASLWRTEDGARRPYSISPGVAYYDFVAMAISDDGATAAYVPDTGGIDVTTPAPRGAAATVRAHLATGGEVGQIAIGGSDIVVASHDGVLSVWDLRRSSPIQISTPLPPGEAQTMAHALPGSEPVMAPNHSGTALAFGDYWSFSILDNRGATLFKVGGVPTAAHFLGWRSDTHVLYLSDGEVREYDIAARHQVQAHKTPELKTASGAWDARAGQVILADATGAYHRIDPDDGTTTRLSTSGRAVAGFSRDGSYVLLKEGAAPAVVYSVWDSELRHQLLEHSQIRFTDSDGHVVVGDGPSSALVSLSDPGSIVAEVGADVSVFGGRLVTNGSTYLTASLRGYALLVDSKSTQEWGRIPLTLFQDDTTGEWAHAAFSGDGKRVFFISSSAAFEPVLTVVEVGADRMVGAVCRTVRRSLGAAEWTQITGATPPAELACKDEVPAFAAPASNGLPDPGGTASGADAGPPSGVQVTSGWVTVLDSKPKAEAGAHGAATSLASTLAASSGVAVEVLDTDAHPALTPGYWAVVVTGSSTEGQARAACGLVGREPGPSCYPRSLG